MFVKLVDDATTRGFDTCVFGFDVHVDGHMNEVYANALTPREAALFAESLQSVRTFVVGGRLTELVDDAGRRYIARRLNGMLED